MSRYWETEFDTAKDLIIHTFSNRVKVSTSTKTGEVKITQDDKTIDRFQNMPISDYENLLRRIAVDAYNLKGFSNDRLK